MQIITTIAAMRDAAQGWRRAQNTIALVPTTGNLHAGKLALISHARSDAQRLVVSISPPQPLTDAQSDTDLTQLRAAGVDAVFKPDAANRLPADAQTIVETTDLARILIGKLHPGHFRTAATNAARLFNITQPDSAVFGERDYQHLCIIRQMVRDLAIPVRISSVPTQRDSDGLALSTRNAYLSVEDRAAATLLCRTLNAAADMARTGITASRLRAWVAASIQAEPRADLQLADLRDAETLHPLAGPLTRPAVILLAARFGKVPLIDARRLEP